MKTPLVTCARARGSIVWLTGVPGVGKTTLAHGISDALAPRAPAVILDGDDLRGELWPELGFSRADRAANVARLCALGLRLARRGITCVVAAIAPYAEDRRLVRDSAAERGIGYFEIYLRATREVLMARDPKGHYRQALAGDLPHFTGISAPYEAPVAPDLTLDTDCTPVEGCVERVVGLLDARGVFALDQESSPC